MKRTALAVILALTSGFALGCGERTEDTAPTPPEFVPGELLVKFKGTVQATQVQSTFNAAGIAAVEYFAGVGVYRSRVTAAQDVTEAVAACRNDPNIVYAEPNYIYHATRVPDDPRFGELWAMQNANDADVDAVEAWDTQTGSRDVVVAIIDTGVDPHHEDLQANMWHNPGESGQGRETNGVDDDNNGFVDDVFGWDFASNDNDPMDDNGHGTHVAGTIAAAGDNGTGVVGVSWKASIMALKFLGANGSGSAADAIRAIEYAAANGARVLNNSWGGGGFSQALKEAIELARDRDAIFVAAAGNEGRDNDASPNYPSNYDVDNVVAVAASDRNDALASFSNVGQTTVDLAAPGVAILSAQPGNRYQSLSGTSMATPHVAGAAVLVLSQFPGIDHRAAMVRLVGSVDRKSQFTSTTASGGRLNVQRALGDQPLVAFVTRHTDTDDTTGPYGVDADAVDDGVVQAVELQWSVDGGTPVTVAMNAVGGTRYHAEIPGQALDTAITYFVRVRDDAGNVGESPSFAFSIREGGSNPQPPDCGRFALMLPGGPGNGPWNGAWLVLLNGLAFVAVVLGLRVAWTRRT